MSVHRSVLIVAALLVTAAASPTRANQDPKAPDDADLTTLVTGNTRFALDLYDQLRKTDGNLFFSPASLSTALAMTYGGARGDTAAEMAKVLHFELEPDRLHSAVARLLSNLDTSGPEQAGCRLHIANALWPQRGHEFLPEFLDLGRFRYRARLETVDYVRSTELARQTINLWVEQRTEGKIKELLKPGILTGLTRLVLTNAVYFKGDWATKFDQRKTKDAPFTLVGGSRVDVPMMNQTGEFGYLEDDDLQVLELPYAGEALSMAFLLPREHDGLPSLEKSLRGKKLAGWLAKLEQTKVRVSLPRFKLESEFKLNEILAAMGMPTAFDMEKADLSGMDGTKFLFISAVVHKAYVDVNEEGTEAAAATGVAVALRSGPTAPPTFRADHPFLFLIRDLRTGSILFLGRVTDPTD